MPRQNNGKSRQNNGKSRHSLYDEPTVEVRARLPRSMHTQLAARAHRNGRTIASELVQILRLFVSRIAEKEDE